MVAECEQVVQLLKELQATVVPRCVDSGEAITYLAYKDAILSKCMELLTLTEAEHTLPDAQQQLLVDHQQLAATVIERTFDTHAQLLRSKLAAAERDAEMWKKAALYGSGSGGAKIVSHGIPPALSNTLCIPARVTAGTQAGSSQQDAADVADSTSPLAGAFPRFAAGELFASWSEHLLSTADKKIHLWCASATTSSFARAAMVDEEQRSTSVAAEKKTGLFSRKSSSTLSSPGFGRGAPTSRKASRSGNGDAGSCRASASLLFEPVEHGVQDMNASTPRNTSLNTLTAASSHAADTALERADASSPLYVMRPVTFSARKTRTRSKPRGPAVNHSHGGRAHLPKI